jgi:hypothetical protein
LIKAAFWPGVVVLGGWKFRSEIHELLTGLLSLKVAGFEATFDKSLAATRRKLPPETLDAAKESEGFETLADLAQVAPIDAIIKAWAKLEDVLIDLASKIGLQSSVIGRRQVGRLIPELQKSEKVSPQVISAIEELRLLRNQAVHEPAFALSPDAATQFVLLALASVEDLKRIGG